MKRAIYKNTYQMCGDCETVYNGIYSECPECGSGSYSEINDDLICEACGEHHEHELDWQKCFDKIYDGSNAICYIVENTDREELPESEISGMIKENGTQSYLWQLLTENGVMVNEFIRFSQRQFEKYKAADERIYVTVLPMTGKSAV